MRPLPLLDLQIANAEVEVGSGGAIRTRKHHLEVDRFDPCLIEWRSTRVVLHGRVGHGAVERACVGNHQVGAVVAGRFLAAQTASLVLGSQAAAWEVIRVPEAKPQQVRWARMPPVAGKRPAPM